MAAGEFNLPAKVSLYERNAQLALDKACAAKDPEIQRNWNELAEGWFKLAECAEALRKSG